MTDEQRQTVEAMQRYGGSFVQALGKAAILADVQNFARLEAAFPDYFAEYLYIAQLRTRQLQHAKDTHS